MCDLAPQDAVLVVGGLKQEILRESVGVPLSPLTGALVSTPYGAAGLHPASLGTRGPREDRLFDVPQRNHRIRVEHEANVSVGAGRVKPQTWYSPPRSPTS
jgi:hypothetical protein